MADSFYGGKRGFSFVFKENSREGSGGKWTSVGSQTDSDDLDTLYSGIKRGNLFAGEYAMIAGDTDTRIYRITITGHPIEISRIPAIEGNVKMAKWHTGIELTGQSVIITNNIENANVQDMYLNIETGDIYLCTEEDTWAWQDNIKGPKGDPGDLILNVSAQAGGQTTQKILFNSNYQISTLSAVNIGPNIGRNGLGTDVISDATNYPDLGHAVFYESIIDNDANRNCLFIYEGGVMPPCISFSQYVSVFIGGNILNNDNLATRLPAGKYLALSQGLLRVGNWNEPLALWWYVSSGDPIRTAKVGTANPNSTSINVGSSAPHLMNGDYSNGTSEIIYQEGIKKNIYTVYSDNNGVNGWLLVKDILQGAQSVLELS